MVLNLIILSAICGLSSNLIPTRKQIIKKYSFLLTNDWYQNMKILPQSLKIFSGIIGGVISSVFIDDLSGGNLLNNLISVNEVLIIVAAAISGGKILTIVIDAIYSAME